MKPFRALSTALTLLPVILLSGSCASSSGTSDPPSRSEYHIVVAGERVPIGTRVVSFLDPGGFDGRLERCFFHPDRALPSHPAPGCDTANRWRPRPADDLSDAVRERVERDGWTRDSLAQRVHQVLFHYDACATSRRCFDVLHDQRGLSCHFLLDVDGTLYQTLDLDARARHGGLVNDMSIGIEIAHIGAYPPDDPRWRDVYVETPEGLVLSVPETWGAPAGTFRPARPGVFRGRLAGRLVEMPDYTEAQYRALEELLTVLLHEFPLLRADVPRDAEGGVSEATLTSAEARNFRGLLGHFHVSGVKVDPGPAFDWSRLVAVPRRASPSRAFSPSN